MRTRTIPFVLALLVGLVVLAPLPCGAQEQPAAQGSQSAVQQQSELQEYAQREAASTGLDEFVGGHAGVIIAVALIVAVVVILAILIPW